MAVPTKLKGKQLRHLRALAHALKPIVQIGKHGFTDAVRAQLDHALVDHELVKVRVGSECPDDRKELGARAANELSAHLAQTIGAVLVLYRAHPKEPQIRLPKDA